MSASKILSKSHGFHLGHFYHLVLAFFLAGGYCPALPRQQLWWTADLLRPRLPRHALARRRGAPRHGGRGGVAKGPQLPHLRASHEQRGGGAGGQLVVEPGGTGGKGGSGRKDFRAVRIFIKPRTSVEVFVFSSTRIAQTFGMFQSWCRWGPSMYDKQQVNVCCCNAKAPWPGGRLVTFKPTPPSKALRIPWWSKEYPYKIKRRH